MTVLQSWKESIQYLYQWSKIKEFWAEFFANMGYVIWYGIKYFWWSILIILALSWFEFFYLVLFVQISTLPLIHIIAYRGFKKKIWDYELYSLLCALCIAFILVVLSLFLPDLRGEIGAILLAVLLIFASVSFSLFFYLILSFFDEEKIYNLFSGLKKGLVKFFAWLPLIILVGFMTLGILYICLSLAMYIYELMINMLFEKVLIDSVTNKVISAQEILTSENLMLVMREKFTGFTIEDFKIDMFFDLFLSMLTSVILLSSGITLYRLQVIKKR